MSDRERYQRAAELFLRVRLLAVHERTTELEKHINGDDLLRQEVLELLEHDVDDAATSFTPRAATPHRAGEPHARPLLPQLGMIGPYRVIDRIGRGSSGHVFLAEQEKPIRRRVAIKVVPQAAINEELAARFDVERRALECTDHPNIARVLDAGRTQDGLPYLVMDYVEGEPITTYASRRNLNLVARIRLMLDVADAVQHAHQRGVIHRDIKPANILVTEHDGKVVPHVLDFGIAKPIAGFAGADNPEHPAATAGLPLGTPSYMAPEQTGLAPVDTRADVYALGAVLYELVTGTPPIDGTGDPVEVLQRIRNEIPAPASKRMRDRHASSKNETSLSSGGDLDCILACALEKSPERRYATVAALADDLQRMLRYEPIAARPPTLSYRAARFVQRNRLLVGTAALVAIIAAVAIVAVTASIIETRHQRNVALDQYDAQAEINRFLTDDLLAAASPDELGKDVTALDLLHRASKRIDERFATRPVIAASLHHTLGDAFARLGAFEDAHRHLTKGVELRRMHTGADSIETVHSEIALASMMASWNKLEEAEPLLIEALQRAERLLPPDDPARYTALNDLGVLLDSVGKHQQAAEALERALAGRRRVLGPTHQQVFITIGNLALAYDHLGQPQRSLDSMLEALQIAETLPEPPRIALLGLNNNIGATLQDFDRDSEAAPYLRKAADMANDYLGPAHPDTLTIMGNLAGLEGSLGDPVRGAELYDEVVKQRTALYGFTAADTLTSRFGYWNSIWKSGRIEDSVTGFTDLLRDAQQTLGEEHWFTTQCRAFLARTLVDSGRAEEALTHAEHAEAQFLKLYGEDHARTQSVRHTLGLIRKAMAE